MKVHVQAQREQPWKMLRKGIQCPNPFQMSGAQWGRKLPRGSLRDPPIRSPSLPLFLQVNPFPVPPSARLGLLNAFPETEGAEPAAFVTERGAARRRGCQAQGRGSRQTVSSDPVTRRRDRCLLPPS